MTDKIFLSQPEDEDNLIEVDPAEVRVSFNGEKQRFKRCEIIRIRFICVSEMSALVCGVLMGVLGILSARANVPLGMLIMVVGALAFHVGMEWERRLVIMLDSGTVYTLRFFNREERGIHAALTKYGYLGQERPQRLFRPR